MSGENWEEKGSKRPKGEDPKGEEKTKAASEDAPTSRPSDEEKRATEPAEDGDEQAASPGPDEGESAERSADPAPKRPPAKPRRALRIGGAIAAVLVVLFAILWFSLDDRVVFDQGLELTSVTVPHEVVPGGQLPITLTFHATRALAEDDWVFVHVESTRPNDPCRIVFDHTIEPAPKSWGDQVVEYKATIPVPGSCAPGRFEILTGLYSRSTWARLKVFRPRTMDNRVHAAFVDIVATSADSSPRVITPRQINVLEYWGIFRPWLPWFGAMAVAALLAVILARVRQEAKAKEAPLHPVLRWISLLAPAIPFILGILVVLEFVKDDAYISFRYAHNFVHGKGLVFNPGEKLEGYTNFLWTMLMTPFEALGWDLFQVCEVLGTALSIIAFVLVTLTIGWVNRPRKDLSQTWAAAWLATSSSLTLWAKSGLEQPLAQLLPLVGVYLLWVKGEAHTTRAGEALPNEAYSADWRSRRAKMFLASGVVFGLGCLTRPELHAIAFIVGVPLLGDAIFAKIRGRSSTWLPKPTILWFGGLLAVTIPFHVFRVAYYHSLFPNTFYVKTGTGALIWREGVKTLRDMFEFNWTGALAIAAPLAFMNRRRLVEKTVMAVIAVVFMVYYVKVGVDEMQWHRLYLPALPFLAALAALGMQNLFDAVIAYFKAESWRNWAFAAGWALVAYTGWNSFQFTYKELHGFDGHGDLAGTYHPDLGKFLVRHERPGGLVAFQDMGSTPYHAPDIAFLDFIGLVDGTVAHARHDYGLHAFVPADPDNNQQKYDADMRAYFFKRNPEWVILTVYTPKGQEQQIAKAFEKNPGPEAIGEAYSNNPYQFGLWNDPKFHESYVHVRTWPRSIGYYLSLFRRRDLWEKTPGEVVLDDVPQGMPSLHVKFDHGLEMLGADVTKETLERHEVFLTTWWKLPGPLDKDVTFFVHVTKQGFQVTGDHTPGDSMYPADRWQPGQIMEDRTLFQLPPPPIAMTPGVYSVYMGVYRRSTGERFKILEGPNDGQDRVLIGTFTVNRLYPIIHQLIPPTHVDVMRKYPDRIIDAGRKEGE